MLRLNTVLSAFAVSAILLSGTTSQAIKAAPKKTTQTFNDDHSGEAAAATQPACPTPPPCPACPKCSGGGSAEAAGSKVVVEWAGADEADHHRVINHWSLAAFSSPGLTLGGGGGGGGAGTAPIPVLGTRYWMKEGETYDWGIDVGLGLLISTASTSVTTAGTSTSTSTPSPLGFWLHGGMPFAFYSGQHYTFELVPELDIAYASASANGTSATGFHFQAGAKVGPEIHFGFINIPELSIQPTMGLFLGYTTSGTSTPGNNGTSTGTFSFGTQNAGGGTLFGIFGGLNAFYYF